MEKTDSFVKHDETLWTLDGDWEGTSFRRRMTVMKTVGGGLVVHSAIDLPDHQWQELETLGRVEAIVIPNYFHSSEAATYAGRFPSAKVFSPNGMLKKIQRLSPEGRVLSLEHDWSSSQWSTDIECVPIEGLRMVEENVFLHKSSRTLVLCDMAFNMNPERFAPFERMIMKWNRIGLGFGPSRLATSFFIKNRDLAGRSFYQISKLDFERIIVNHGDIVQTNGKRIFADAFSNWIVSSP